MISRIEELVQTLIAEAVQKHRSVPFSFVNQVGVDKEGLRDCIATAGLMPEPPVIQVALPGEIVEEHEEGTLTTAQKFQVSCLGCSRVFIVKGEK